MCTISQSSHPRYASSCKKLVVTQPITMMDKKNQHSLHSTQVWVISHLLCGLPAL